MQVEQEYILKKFRTNIELLISAYETLKKENESLLAKQENLENLLKEKEQLLGEIEGKYNQQQLAKAVLASSGDNHDAKIKVNRIVREIDQCIALLNRY
ncbi:MAG: hypothetical protein WBI34_00035 [Tenuifilaceae bacterium]|jgi:dsDNA-specific endonuclease/ATPase MutS2|nr:hypothetical protein [Bacteroidales bacterium]MDI9516404.1 hypothetical protein [Bacteroidota bacterium]NLH55236.1 hypothetical protein [Rikenellaceae bacterium]OQC64762.1 MAG: hypothetical protein BWX49_00413 [Bacteroidetes bacterium ADurb.Bin008]HNV82088.1 hypothetical protein [Tenuifilaceae bacterium]